MSFQFHIVGIELIYDLASSCSGFALSARWPQKPLVSPSNALFQHYPRMPKRPMLSIQFSHAIAAKRLQLSLKC